MGIQQRPLRTSFVVLALLLSSCNSNPSPLSSAKQIPIQHNGRIKSFDAFARSTVSLISGKEIWQRQPAIVTLLSAIAHRDKINRLEWIRIDHNELKETLDLAKEKSYFSANQILPSVGKIISLVQKSQAKRNQDLRPTKLEQKAEQLYSQLIAVQKLESGESIAVIPGRDADSPWQSPWMTTDEGKTNFENVLQFYASGNFNSFEKTVKQWLSQVDHFLTPRLKTNIQLEIFYYQLQPFHWALIFYLIAFLLLTLWNGFSLRRFGKLSAILALLSHSLGIILRVIILERPPVSNMYESMIYMNWALMIFAVIFSIAWKNSIAISIGSLISALVMIYAHLLPLDSSMDVLVPVLRSNYWLTIHVMTIVSSYGAFGLAMALGHRHLFLSSRGQLPTLMETESAHLIYRVIQLGVLLIGIGTVLGGVWANESWGRFWGWDPKETWALITFLGYLVIVHARHAKWLDNFGLAVGSVLGFLLVLMTWYGVNFVLGRGLHSYGFGSGGIVWIIYYLIFEGTFLTWTIFLKLKAK